MKTNLIDIVRKEMCMGELSTFEQRLLKSLYAHITENIKTAIAKAETPQEIARLLVLQQDLTLGDL